MTISTSSQGDIAIINCGVGNIGSLENAIVTHNYKVNVVSSPDNLKDYRCLLLPGVGSFGGFMQRLENFGFIPALSEFIEKEGTKLIGICVGMQVLFEKGYENGEHKGLGFIPGEVSLITPETEGLRVPHVGWNNVVFNETALMDFNGDYYFTHSYQAITESKYVNGIVNYGYEMTASVKKGPVSGFQFHPEKSGLLGNQLISFACI